MGPAPLHDRRVAIDLDQLLAADLQDQNGQATTLRTQLGPRTTVVVFLRHFG
jgi:hypothetical protein